MTKTKAQLIITFTIVLVLCLTSLTSADSGSLGYGDMDSQGSLIIHGADLNSIGQFAMVEPVGSGPGIEAVVRPPAMLARADYQRVYDAAISLLIEATGFRTNELQLSTTVSCAGLTSDELAACLLKNYKDFNGGRLFYRFCASFEPQSASQPKTDTDLSGACKPWSELSVSEQQARVADSITKSLEEPLDVRNKLLLARDYFGFLSLGPAEQQIDQGDVRSVGQLGVLSATREIANVHLIFGQEYMVDATDYRFGGNDPRADAILQEEIKQLKFAVQQFQLGVDVLAYAFNADFGGPGGKRIGDFFSENEYDLFNTVSERMIDSLSELALRYRQLGDNQAALELYANAFRDQYVQSLAIADSARKNSTSFLQNGGWRLMNNLEHLRARAQTIYNGINPFGFPPEYVPLQSYSDLLNITRGGDGKSGLYKDAAEDELDARQAQIVFDQNTTLMKGKLILMRENYEGKLSELCGLQTNYFQTCDRGLMLRNYLDMNAALSEINLAYDAIQQIPEQIKIEEESVGTVINLILENGNKLSAFNHARGLINLVTSTDIVVDSNSRDIYGGAEARFEASTGFKIPPVSFSASLSAFGGVRWSKTHTSSTQKVTNWDAIELAELDSYQALEQATHQANIEQIQSAAIVKGLLLQQVAKQIQYDLAINRYNQVASEHNSLVDQYHLWLNLWNQAQDEMADSYINNPAYRIMRDALTIESSRSFNLAAQFVYLTAKAAEYDLLEPYPELNQVFKARTADDLDNYLNNLHTWYFSELTPGSLNRFPYRISVTCDILHLYDQNLNPDPKLCKEQTPDVRFSEFQKFLQPHLIKDSLGKVTGLEFSFSTSLVDNNIFSQSIWNNRIAGVNAPLQRSNGLAINLYLRQLGNIGQPEIILTHDGHTTYRKRDGSIVYYAPNTAQPIGWGTPDSLRPKSTTGVILTTLNGDFTNTGEPTNAFINLSVAASNWTLKIDLTSPRNANLDLSQIEDIEIIMDTTGIARSGMEQTAQVDALQLQSDYDAIVIQ